MTSKAFWRGAANERLSALLRSDGLISSIAFTVSLVPIIGASRVTLRGNENMENPGASVRIFIMGGGDAHKTPEGRLFLGGGWRDEREWPLARTVYAAYYLYSGGTLSTQPPKAPSIATRYSFDPRNPVPTIE